MASLSSRPPFSGWHVPPLFFATAFTFGGALPIWKPARAMREYGLPDHTVASPQAQSCFIAYGSRMTVIGAAIYVFYFKGDLEAVDIILSLIPWAGAVDGYVCWKEGVPVQALFRFLSSVALGAWGFFRLSSRA